MRVHITYAEDLERIPELIGGFLSDCTTSLMKQSAEIHEAQPLVTADGYAIQALERIDKIRQELARVDQRLEDAAKMIGGLHNAKYGNVTPDVMDTEENTEGTQDAETESETG